MSAADEPTARGPAPRPAPGGARYERLDALRGVAVVWMAAFHFCFDLNEFGLWRPVQHFLQDPFWTVQRSCIVTLFLLCAGLGQAVALRGGARRPRWPRWPALDGRFWRRWAQVAGCAVLVSIGSALMFPHSWIFFGVLHGIAVMLVLVRLAAPLGGWLWLPALAAIAAPLLFRHPLFDAPVLLWVGLVTHKPVTQDWVPLLPWVGVVWLGYAAGHRLLARPPAWAVAPVPRALAPLAVLGRWSLSFYMLHQPLLIGVLALGRRLGWW